MSIWCVNVDRSDDRGRAGCRCCVRSATSSRSLLWRPRESSWHRSALHSSPCFWRGRWVSVWSGSAQGVAVPSSGRSDAAYRVDEVSTGEGLRFRHPAWPGHHGCAGRDAIPRSARAGRDAGAQIRAVWPVDPLEAHVVGLTPVARKGASNTSAHRSVRACRWCAITGTIRPLGSVSPDIGATSVRRSSCRQSTPRL